MKPEVGWYEDEEDRVDINYGYYVYINGSLWTGK